MQAMVSYSKFPGMVRVAVVAIALGVLSSFPSIASAEDDGRLSAIGGLSAAHMYTTYIAIGATGDAFGNDVYDTEQVQSIMGGLVNVIDTLKKQLLLVQEHCDDRADREYIDEVIEVYNLLQEEARQLSAFSESRDVSDHRAYEKARTTVWPRIEKLLGLDE